jgi:hypothetical protein
VRSLFSIFLTTGLLVPQTGCSRVQQVPREEWVGSGTIDEATVRTRSGEVYYFERASVAADTLHGFAQETRTVFLEGGEVQEVTEAREVHVPVADVEQMTVRRRDWKRGGLWALAAAGIAGAIAVVAGSDDDVSGGGSGGGKPPP